MKTVDTTEIDRWVERMLALISVLATLAGLGAERFPRAAVALLLILTLALVITAVVSERARKGLPDRPDYSDSDRYLAAVANSDLERAA